MTETQALLTIARRYCLEQHFYWADKYSHEQSGNNSPYSDNDYNLFPRYNALNAILQGLETIVGQPFVSLDICKKEIKQIGLNNQDMFISGKQNPVSRAAIQDEKKKFIKFVDNVSAIDLENIEPLPHKRRLKEEEANQIRRQLHEIWNYDGSYWEPLDNKSPQPTLFLMKENVNDNDIEKIIQFIATKADEKIFAISEDRIDYEIEIDSFSPDLYETICCDKTFEWVIYGSHESTIAFGGSYLLEFITVLFSDRKEKLNLWEQNW
jgi:hypothetical protein